MHRRSVVLSTRSFAGWICGLWLLATILVPVHFANSFHDANSDQSISVCNSSAIHFADTSSTEVSYRLLPAIWKVDCPTHGWSDYEVNQRVVSVSHSVDKCLREAMQPSLLRLGVALRL